MSFSDSLENDLKNLEGREERDPASAGRAQGKRQSERARALAAAPNAEKLKNSKFTAGLLRHATRIGFGMRTKVRISWIGQTLRLEAREHRIDLIPAGDGIMTHYSVDGVERSASKLDLNADPERFAKKWLDTVGPPPAPVPIPEFDDE